jgi:hypothetical protein
MKQNIILLLLVTFYPVKGQITGRMDYDSTSQLQSLSRNLSEVSVTAYHNPEKLISVAGAVSVVPVDSLQYAGYNIVSSLSASPGLIWHQLQWENYQP